MRMTILSAAMIALPALAQNPGPTRYVMATYSKWRPDQAEEGRKFLTEVANKVVVARNGAGGSHIGQVRLYRVFPSSAETGHDVLRLVFHSSPPDLADTETSAAVLAGTGMTPAEYGRKLRSIHDLVKQELWTDVFRHGSMSPGDYVRITWSDPPVERTGEYALFLREFGGPMAAHGVKQGTLKGWDTWRLALVTDPAPYNFVSVTVYQNSAGLIKGLGKQTEAFDAAFPKGDYNLYIRRYRELTHLVKSVVYRVDSAIWK